MKRRRPLPLQPSMACQLLEDRALLSATLDNGVLTVEGSDADDRVRIHPEHENPDTLIVKVNDEVSRFPVADVTSIVVNAGDGNDHVKVGKRVQAPATLNGEGGNDFLQGGGADDEINGGAGLDRLAGGRGSDLMNGGDDHDRMNGGSGSDTMNGGGGNDHMKGHFGPDVMNGGDGNDVMSGSRGNDVMAGEDGDDHMRGDSGDDDMSGGEGNDMMIAGPGSDMLFGEGGDDTLVGNSATDILDGGTGDNEIRDDHGGGNGGGGDFDARKRASLIFRRLDSNRDRVLTSDEVSEGRWTELLEFDADDSGDIVFAEFFEWFKEKTDRRGGGGGGGGRR